ncbi:uncharacterized protein LOC118644798 [Monomorium pharaonis]|uniref:uncharacterized protein LOC118644798 n=1 Tax=Monomorium pharaonis TaxID=307658 RepID=UPI0017460FB2|nr:uncharacterized protein LOC118644798 [Monomorium pharaonis]
MAAVAISLIRERIRPLHARQGLTDLDESSLATGWTAAPRFGGFNLTRISWIPSARSIRSGLRITLTVEQHRRHLRRPQTLPARNPATTTPPWSSLPNAAVSIRSAKATPGPGQRRRERTAIRIRTGTRRTLGATPRTRGTLETVRKGRGPRRSRIRQRRTRQEGRPRVPFQDRNRRWPRAISRRRRRRSTIHLSSTPWIATRNEPINAGASFTVPRDGPRVIISRQSRQDNRRFLTNPRIS